MKLFRMMVPLSLSLVTLWAGPSAVDAQETPAIVALEAAAAAAGNHGLWEPAAALFTEAAALRSFGDAKTIEALRTAALLRHYAGDRTEALRLMSGAAGEAVATGHFFLAAESYVDGAWLALEMDLVPTARQFMESAVLIAESLNLNASESSSILARLGEREPVLRLSER
jgi:hypothetical protein